MNTCVVNMVIQAAILLVYLAMAVVLYRQLRSSERASVTASFVQVYTFVDKHHSPKIADYRRFAREVLAQKCAEARKDGKSLKQYDLDASRKASNVANYYECMSMLLEYAGKDMYSNVQRMLLDMVHVSAYEIWEIFYENLDTIHPGHIGTWAGSWEKLYQRIGEFNEDLPTRKPPVKRY